MKDLEKLVDKFLHNTITDQELNQLMNFISKPENEQHFKSLMDVHWKDDVRQQPKINRTTETIASTQANRPKKPVGMAWIRMAAMIVLTIGLCWIGYQYQDEIMNTMVSYREVKTEEGQIAEIKLPDGSLIKMNQHSTLKYPEKFKNRYIELEGEAFFKVARDEQRPFRIVTQQGEIEVLGTMFNVKQNSDSSLAVAVSEGKVALRTGQQEAILKHGDLGVIANRQVNVRQVNNISNYASWFSHRLVFEETTLADIALQLEDIFHVVITIPSDSVKNMVLSFQMKKAPVEKVLHEIALTLSLKINHQGNHFTVTK